MFFSHTNPYISKSMLRKNADVRQCSYFELGLHVITTVHFATVHVLLCCVYTEAFTKVNIN